METPEPRALTAADFLPPPEKRRPKLHGPVDVPHPEDPTKVWGRVWLLRMSGRDRDDWQVVKYRLSAAGEGDDFATARNESAHLVALGVRAEDGSALFTPEQAEELGAEPGLGQVLRWLKEQVERVNLLRPEDDAALQGKSVRVQSLNA